MMRLSGAKICNSLERYLLAVATIALAAVLQLGVHRLVGDDVPFIFFHPALVLIAVYCGRGPALLALLASAGYSALALHVLSNEHSATGARYSVLIYVAVGLLIVLVTSTLRGVTQRAHAAETRYIQELHDVDRRRTEFLATLAHELRNPLAPIRHATQLAQSPHTSVEQVRWALAVIDRQVSHMTRLLEDLLEASRISRGALELRPERVELAAIIAMAAETTKPLLDGKGHQLQLFVPARPIWLQADPVRLAQVFSNLLTNAAKYTPSGGQISIRAEETDEQVVVHVRDNGIGIAPDVLPRLFELFAQADTAMEHAQGGLGIGLALAKGLVQLHGGTIAAHSDGPNRGSEFTVHLPRTVAPAPAVSRDVRPAFAQVVPRRILVADDNRDAADSLALLLQLDGHEVQVAYDGAVALQVCERSQPHVMLLDIGMPQLDGYELARRIRGEDWGAQMKLIAITGWGQKADRTRALEAGFDAHLTKPVTAEAIATILASTEDRIAAA